MSAPPADRLVRAVLLNVEAVTAIVDRGIYAKRIPPKALAPLVLIPPGFATPSAAPTLTWWEHVVTLDLQSEDSDEADDLLEAILEAVPLIVGKHTTGVVADAEVESIQDIYDDAWSPKPRYRHVVTVALTAREP